MQIRTVMNGYFRNERFTYNRACESNLVKSGDFGKKESRQTYNDRKSRVKVNCRSK